ncbi:hypothetical protein [Natronospirillum operosum]|uniref:hypothetical protein n=1 Tax=Natronospirillum operosum TaxID=2759953 RepID=UPI001436A452|nr:hypothetical protein [Natronospirillum operosum]
MALYTIIRVGQKWRYLSVVMDRFTRRIVSWKLSHEKTAIVTRVALRPALDRGSQHRG